MGRDGRRWVRANLPAAAMSPAEWEVWFAEQYARENGRYNETVQALFHEARAHVRKEKW